MAIYVLKRHHVDQEKANVPLTQIVKVHGLTAQRHVNQHNTETGMKS